MGEAGSSLAGVGGGLEVAEGEAARARAALSLALLLQLVCLRGGRATGMPRTSWGTPMAPWKAVRPLRQRWSIKDLPSTVAMTSSI